MSSNIIIKTNKTDTTNIDTSGDLDLLSYEKIPMDLNFSPLREYFHGVHSSNFKSENTEPSSLSNSDKTMPVIIPGSSDISKHNEKKKHHKSRRKPVAFTVPDNGLEAVMERKQLRQQNEKYKNSHHFTVGSLQEKPPVPWPTALITTADNRHSRLANRQTVNWPLLPQHYFTGDDREDVFSMDNDFYYNSD